MFEMGLAATVVAVSTALAGTPAPAPVSDEARELAAFVNETRAEAGKDPLTFSAPLSTVAQAYAEEMASGRAPFQHNPDLWSQIPDGWVLAGENIAYRSSGTLKQMHQQWVDSPGHYANMTRRFDNIGIGFAISESGVMYAVQVFGLYLDPLDPIPDTPAATPEPTDAPEPTETPQATQSPAPVKTPAPAESPAPTHTSTPSAPAKPVTPSKTVRPSQPITPAAPVVPSQSVVPATPSAPAAPVEQSDTPAEPRTPSDARIGTSDEVTESGMSPPNSTGDTPTAGVGEPESIAAAETTPQDDGSANAAAAVAIGALALGIGGGTAIVVSPRLRTRIRGFFTRHS